MMEMKLKDILLLETPDEIEVPDGFGNYKRIEFNDSDYAKYTFSIYKDSVDKKHHWIAFDYDLEKVISSNRDFLKEINNCDESTKKIILNREINPNDEGYAYSCEQINRDLHFMNLFPSHLKLERLLRLCRRLKESTLTGRLFYYDKRYYFSFWEDSLYSELKKHRRLLDDFIRSIGVNVEDLSFEDTVSVPINFIPYSEIFMSVSKDKPLSDEQLKMRQLKYDLHFKQALLDKSIVLALKSKPKDVDTLYQRLEKNMGMPIYKIRQLFPGISLDKLISKKLNESYSKLKNILVESFEDWFKGSVVKNSDGIPMRMYHGTHVKTIFSTFDTVLRGSWFTANPSEAGAYAGGGDLNKTRKYGRTIPVFLSIKNPKTFTSLEFDEMVDNWIRSGSYKKKMMALKKTLIENSYDGIHIEGSRRDADIYVAFYPEQIRSSISLKEIEYPLAGKDDLQSFPPQLK